MEVNFNNLRKQALFAYDSLAEKLNCSFLEDNEWGTSKTEKREMISGNMLIDSDDIQKDMDNLRMLIGSIASVYEPDDENFKDIYSEVYTDDKRMVSFNPDADE